MSKVIIVESDLKFGPYAEEHCFHIEKGPTYGKLGEGVKIPEFLLLRLAVSKPPQVWVVEAKSSSPRPETQPNFHEYIDDIRQKLTTGFELFIAMFLKRHPNAETELSSDFRKLDLATCEFRLVLVVKGHQLDWLPPLKDKLTKDLHAFVKTWALGPTPVAVLNEELARKHGLII